MDARNSQFLQRTATNSSGSLQTEIAGLPWGLAISVCIPGAAWSGVACPDGFARRELTSALLVLMGVLRLPWHCLVWRAPCVCLGAAWSGERLALALAPVCLAELWRELAPVGCLGSALRLPWRRLVWRVSCDCPGAAWSSERLALALALLVPVGVLRLPWRCLVWRAPCACLGACLLGGVVRC